MYRLSLTDKKRLHAGRASLPVAGSAQIGIESGFLFPPSPKARVALAGILLSIVLASPLNAQVPELGRYQDFAYDDGPVQASAQTAYAERLAQFTEANVLDDDPGITRRVQRIARTLVRVAITEKPDALNWPWEIHTTSDTSETATCYAGGRLLFGSTYIRRLELNDGELATLMAHEIAHAISEHQRELLSQVFFRNESARPLSIQTAMARFDSDLSLQIVLAPLMRIQEHEADQLGMTIAYKAGWTTKTMISFYRKLATSDIPTTLDWSYPTVISRLDMARMLAAILERGH